MYPSPVAGFSDGDSFVSLENNPWCELPDRIQHRLHVSADSGILHQGAHATTVHTLCAKCYIPRILVVRQATSPTPYPPSHLS